MPWSGMTPSLVSFLQLDQQQKQHSNFPGCVALVLFCGMTLLPFEAASSNIISPTKPKMVAIIALDSMNLVHHFLVIILLLIIPWAAPLSFDTSFTFRFDGKNNTVPSHDQGLAFFLAPNGSLLNRALGGGRNMGLPVNSSVENVTEPSNEYPFVAVEFVTFRNSRSTVEDPDCGRVGIKIDSLNYITKPWNSGIVEGEQNRAWIDYNSSSKNLSVSLTTYANDTREQVIISLCSLVDLNKNLPDWVIVGFSSSTGTAPALVDIMSWNFTSLVGDGSLALFSQEKKGQSLVPSAQTIKDESLVPEPSPRTNNVKSRRRKKRMGVVISSAIGGFILACILGLGLYNSCKKKTTGGRADIDLTIPNELGEKISLKKFSYKELARATRNFSDGELLGVGRYGAFYKGCIKEWNIHVAVKKMSRSELVLKEYASQITIISRLAHRNLVQLLGWCQQKGELLLVYEFMPNGSLNNYLFKAQISLVWEVRYKIAQDLAFALLYLHEHCEVCVLHRGITSSNIMLDSDFNAKLGDFRLARYPCEKHWDTMLLAPEYAATQTVTKEFDVYSFGVVALEISCGRKAIEPRFASGRVNIIEWVSELYGEGKIIEAADPKLCGSFDGKQMECLLIVGLWCAYPDYSYKPSMQLVIQVLNCEVEVPLLILPLRTPMSTSRPDIPLSASSSSTTSFQENSGSSGHGDMDNTNSLAQERVVESLDPSKPVTVVLHPESNIATPLSRTPMTTSPDIPLSASSISTTRIENKNKGPQAMVSMVPEGVVVILDPAVLSSRTPTTTSPDISLSALSSSTTSFQEKSGSSGHGDVDNTSSLVPEGVVESLDPSDSG
ncbi:L-type lectin-domain containing receptor kinase IX.1-like [Pyrus x bretschneideri]|uniref:L-type lectin-domain containing receptor kinase IX.1-like n=1 Tax=Pyrus x bretschneideri TaxID=225117 RepID=UPI00202EA907|nr:L-type lectin-domain containing receptor kinase IX.1-like [Pyrus x bretschneideri]